MQHATAQIQVAQHVAGGTNRIRLSLGIGIEILHHAVASRSDHPAVFGNHSPNGPLV